MCDPATAQGPSSWNGEGMVAPSPPPSLGTVGLSGSPLSPFLFPLPPLSPRFVYFGHVIDFVRSQCRLLPSLAPFTGHKAHFPRSPLPPLGGVILGGDHTIPLSLGRTVGHGPCEVSAGGDHTIPPRPGGNRGLWAQVHIHMYIYVSIDVYTYM